MIVKSEPVITVSAVITRKDGRIENLGIISTNKNKEDK